MLQRSLVLLAMYLVSMSCSIAQTVKDASDAAGPNTVKKESAEKGVVILALGSLGSRRTLDLEADESEDRSNALPLGDPMVRIQLNIATIAAKDGQVLLLVADARSKTRLLENCAVEEGLCELLDQGFVRVDVVPHEGPWIRDYGPVFGRTSTGAPVVLDANYHDIRAESNQHAQLTEIQYRRLALAKRLFVERTVDGLKLRLTGSAGPDDERDETADDGALEHGTRAAEPRELEAAQEPAGVESTEAQRQVPSRSGRSEVRRPESDDQADLDEEDDAREPLPVRPTGAVHSKRAFSATERELELYDRLADVYRHLDVNRTIDDESPYDIALAVMRKPESLVVVRPGLDLDGGNLLQSDDGRCFTTRTLLSRNRHRELDVTRRLESVYGCHGVVYLEALPGPVIEHVDMFLLPATGKKLFLASYDPADPLIAAHWGEMRPVERRTAEEAAVAMKENEQQLRALGYDVIPVPSPLPRVVEGEVYYPTVLNGLVQMDRTGKPHVILPRYDRYQEDIQGNAWKVIREQFGTQLALDTVESTVAASRQGAVHCLTIIAPLQMTIYADAELNSLRQQVALASRRAMQQSSASMSESQLLGSWLPTGSDEDPDLRITFANHRMQIEAGTAAPLSFGYQIASRDRSTWKLQLDDDQAKFDVALEWSDKNHIRLILDKDTTIALQRE